jgi:hypothetical protein
MVLLFVWHFSLFDRNSGDINSELILFVLTPEMALCLLIVNRVIGNFWTTRSSS